jgi:DNA end-binding protein Ku
VCKTRLRQPLYCPHCERIVERNEVVKGYEEKDGSYVLIEPEEIKKIQPESSRVMDILSFANQNEIDPLFFDSSYFIVAEEEGRKAYQLLLKTLEDSKRVGISKVTMHQREYTAFIRPYDRGLVLHTMYFENEIREAPGYGKTDNVKLRPQEVKLAEQLVGSLSEEFHIEHYHDEFQARMQALIEAKEKGKEVVAEPAAKRAPVIDMMSALKKSLETAGGTQARKPARAASHHRHRAAS